MSVQGSRRCSTREKRFAIERKGKWVGVWEKLVKEEVRTTKGTKIKVVEPRQLQGSSRSVPSLCVLILVSAPALVPRGISEGSLNQVSARPFVDLPKDTSISVRPGHFAEDLEGVPEASPYILRLLILLRCRVCPNCT